MMKMDSNYDISVEKRPKSPDVNLAIGYDINSARNTNPAGRNVENDGDAPDHAHPASR